MTTATLKKKLVNAINREEDKGLLEFFYALLAAESTQKRISRKEYNRELDKGTEEIIEGKTFSHEAVIKEARKWLKRK